MVKPRLVGRVFLIRDADDFVLGFTCEADARRVLEVLPQRFAKSGLTMSGSNGCPVETGSVTGRGHVDNVVLAVSQYPRPD